MKAKVFSPMVVSDGFELEISLEKFSGLVLKENILKTEII